MNEQNPYRRRLNPDLRQHAVKMWFEDGESIEVRGFASRLLAEKWMELLAHQHLLFGTELEEYTQVRRAILVPLNVSAN